MRATLFFAIHTAFGRALPQVPGEPFQTRYRSRGAEEFHTDGAYDQDPFKATQLYSLAIPSRGGDTHFASGA